MTVAVHMKDVLEPVEADEDFLGFVHALNVTTSSGKQFLIMDAKDGGHIAFNIPNVNLVTEIDD